MVTFAESSVATAKWGNLLVESDNILQSAQNRPLTEEEIRTCFSKTDGLPMDVHFEKITVNGNIFIPKSELKEGWRLVPRLTNTPSERLQAVNTFL